MFSGRIILTLATATLLLTGRAARAQITPPSGETAATAAQTPAVVETPPVPACIAQAERSSAADIAVRSTDPAADRILTRSLSSTITIEAPVTFTIEKAAASGASKFVYAITRAGQIVVSSDKPLSIARSQIKLQHRTDQKPGLRGGPVVLWVWGVDQAGRVSVPIRTPLTIAGQD